MSDLKHRLEEIRDGRLPDNRDLEYCLGLTDPDALASLFAFADQVKKDHVGNDVLIRGIIEFSNFCRNSCFYCGLNKNNTHVTRYCMHPEEIIESVGSLNAAGIKTAILQSGESEKIEAGWLKEIILEIKARFDVAVTLSVGERSLEDYRLWKKAGADRYLLKIETSQKNLYESMHPGMSFENRLRCLKNLRYSGYEVGCGNIVGLKGQTTADLAQDILFFKKEKFDMIGIGPFIAHPYTPLVHEAPGQAEMVLKVLALTRIVTKNTNLPATTALSALEKDYRTEGLNAGANVLMLNFTPAAYKQFYELYPNSIDDPKRGREYAKHTAE